MFGSCTMWQVDREQLMFSSVRWIQKNVRTGWEAHIYR